METRATVFCYVPLGNISKRPVQNALERTAHDKCLTRAIESEASEVKVKATAPLINMTKQATKSPVALILRPLRAPLSRLLLVVGTVWLAAEPAVGQGPKSSRPSDLTFDRCRAITDDAAPRCYEDAISHSDVGGSGQRNALPGAWRLVRTSNPSGGRDAVSIMHTADIARSDVDFAGLMLVAVTTISKF